MFMSLSGGLPEEDIFPFFSFINMSKKEINAYGKKI